MNNRSMLWLALVAVLTVAMPRAGWAQLSDAGEKTEDEMEEFSDLINAFDVTRAAMYDRLVQISERDDFAQEARGQIETIMAGHAETMSMGNMHSMGAMGVMDAMSGMPAAGPALPGGALTEFEDEALGELTTLIREEHSIDDARAAFGQAESLPDRLAAVIERGRRFEARMYDIYFDDGISNKTAAVSAAIDEYLSDPELAVPAQPKVTSLIFGHPYESAFVLSYPRVAGTIWASQWLRLAALEPLVAAAGDDDARQDGVETTIRRFWSKVDGTSGSYPTEMPMVPTIAPSFVNLHPRAGAIIDNLNMLETVVADVLVHPGVADRDQAITAALDEFTNGSQNVASDVDWIYSALRGGIYNQGGPALGILERSERNRSRREMEMGGHVALPGMN